VFTTGGVLALAACAFFLHGIFAPDDRVRADANGVASVSTTAAASAAPTIASAPSAAPTFIVLASAAPSAKPKRKLLANDPDPIPEVKYPTNDGEDRDPFSENSKDPVRTLATSGPIRVGVTKAAELRDEKQVTSILGDLARELETKEKGRTDSYETRAHEYQKTLADYAGKLSPYMSGGFAFHAEGWILFKSVPGAAPAGSANAGP